MARTKNNQFSSSAELANYQLQGRIIGKRDFGKIVFLTLKDDSGTAQIALRKETLGERFKEATDISIGDIVGVYGEAFLTKTQMKTLDVKDYETYAECNIEFPDKHKGVTKAFGYQNRTLDLLANEETFLRFKKRNKIIEEIRLFLYSEGFSEVDTGILQLNTNTSLSSDFVTYSKFLERNLYLRKTPELRLKQLMVGGLEDVFEIGKNFRNEGISREYHPEYTILELYKNYADYRDVLKLTINLLKHLDGKVGEPQSKPTRVRHVSLYDFINIETGINPKKATIDQIRSKIDPEIQKDYGQDEILHKGFYHYDLFRTLLKKYPSENIILHGIPKEISVLGKTYKDEPDLIEEFRYFVQGNLICNGITELNNYEEQKKRILQQSKTHGKSLDDNDNAFLEALKIGLPPCAGIGLGIEKLLMVYSEVENIKDIIYFPL